MLTKTTIALSTAVALSTAFLLAAAQPAFAQKHSAYNAHAQAVPQAQKPGNSHSEFEKVWFDLATADRDRQ